NAGSVLSLTKVGTGTLTLTGQSGNNTATGLTHVQGGVLEVGGGFGGDGGIRGDVTIESGATFRLLQNDVVINSSDFTIALGGTLDMNGYSDVIGNLQGAGNITNNNNGNGITLDDISGTHVFSGNISGTGAFRLRGNVASTGEQVISGGTHTLGTLNVGRGTLTFRNNPTVTVSGTAAVGDYAIVGGSSSILAVLNIESGTFQLLQLDIGNVDVSVSTVGIVNQSGGNVTFSNGAPPDNASLRIGHWPSGNGTYNLSGGELVITNG